MKIAVGIATLNDAARLRRCLDSICRHAPTRLPFRLLVCDDGSREDELEDNKHVVHGHDWLREHCGLEMLMNEARLGIPKTWNRLVQHQHADVHVLLNDDVEVVEHWLDVLSYSVSENERVGMVGLNAFLRRAPSCGCGLAAAVGAIRPPLIDYREAKLSDGGGTLLSSSGFAFAFRRDVYDEVGGFDERYFAFYEEVDFGVSLRERGYGSYIASYPIIEHGIGQTTSDKRNMDAEACMAESRAKFREKWGCKPGDLRGRWPRVAPPEREWNSALVGSVE